MAHHCRPHPRGASTTRTPAQMHRRGAHARSRPSKPRLARSSPTTARSAVRSAFAWYLRACRGSRRGCGRVPAWMWAGSRRGCGRGLRRARTRQMSRRCPSRRRRARGSRPSQSRTRRSCVCPSLVGRRGAVPRVAAASPPRCRQCCRVAGLATCPAPVPRIPCDAAWHDDGVRYTRGWGRLDLACARWWLAHVHRRAGTTANERREHARLPWGSRARAPVQMGESWRICGPGAGRTTRRLAGREGAGLSGNVPTWDRGRSGNGPTQRGTRGRTGLNGHQVLHRNLRLGRPSRRGRVALIRVALLLEHPACPPRTRTTWESG